MTRNESLLCWLIVVVFGLLAVAVVVYDGAL
jgi:hypothetical protein